MAVQQRKTVVTETIKTETTTATKNADHQIGKTWGRDRGKHPYPSCFFPNKNETKKLDSSLQGKLSSGSLLIQKN